MRRSAGRGSRGKDGLGLRSVSRFGSLPARFRAESRPKLEARRRRGGRRSPRSPYPRRGRARSRTRRFTGRLEPGDGAEEGAPPRAASAPPAAAARRRALPPSRAPGPRSAGARVADEWAITCCAPVPRFAPLQTHSGRRGRAGDTHSRAPIFPPFCFSL